MAQNFGDNFMTRVAFEEKGPGSRFMKDFESAKRDFGHTDNPHQTFDMTLNIPGQKKCRNYDPDKSQVTITRSVSVTLSIEHGLTYKTETICNRFSILSS